MTSSCPKVDSVVLDFSDAKDRSNKLDTQILGSANSISETYSNLVSLAARQAMGSTELTVGMGSDGKWNSSDVKMFMKNIGVDGSVPSLFLIMINRPF